MTQQSNVWLECGQARAFLRPPRQLAVFSTMDETGHMGSRTSAELQRIPLTFQSLLTDPLLARFLISALGLVPVRLTDVTLVAQALLTFFQWRIVEGCWYM